MGKKERYNGYTTNFDCLFTGLSADQMHNKIYKICDKDEVVILTKGVPNSVEYVAGARSPNWETPLSYESYYSRINGTTSRLEDMEFKYANIEGCSVSNDEKCFLMSIPQYKYYIGEPPFKKK